MLKLRGHAACTAVMQSYKVLFNTYSNKHLLFLKHHMTNLKLFEQRTLGLTTRGSLTEEELLDTNLMR